MNPKWNVAYSNMTVDYADVTYRHYYASPANMLEAQLKAKEVAEARYGLGRYMVPRIDTISGSVVSLLGMEIIHPQSDELPGVNTSAPLITDVAQAGELRIGDPMKDGLMGFRKEAWDYYHARGYDVALGGKSGDLVTPACELSGHSVLMGIMDNPDDTLRVFETVYEADRRIGEANEQLAGKPSTRGYVGDDFAGLLSPPLFLKYVIPFYRRMYEGKETRFMHSELLRAEHLRMCKNKLSITMFHGAAAEKMTLAEQTEIMGDRWWAQVTPHELAMHSPEQLADRVAVLADSGAGWVQLYPGRNTPARNLEAALVACERHCRRLGHLMRPPH